MASTIDISSIIDQLKFFKTHVFENQANRKSLLEAARALVPALETPGDSIQRIAYIVSCLQLRLSVMLSLIDLFAMQSLQLTAARIACDINLFEALTEKDGSSLSTQELVNKTKTTKHFSVCLTFGDSS